MFSALSQIAKHNVDLAEMVVEAEIFPSVLTSLKDNDGWVRKNAATLIREIAKHTPEVRDPTSICLLSSKTTRKGKTPGKGKTTRKGTVEALDNNYTLLADAYCSTLFLLLLWCHLHWWLHSVKTTTAKFKTIIILLSTG